MKKSLYMLILAGTLAAGTVAWTMAAPGVDDNGKEVNSEQVATTAEARTASRNEARQEEDPAKCARKHATGECSGHEPGQPHESGRHSKNK